MGEREAACARRREAHRTVELFERRGLLDAGHLNADRPGLKEPSGLVELAGADARQHGHAVGLGSADDRRDVGRVQRRVLEVGHEDAEPGEGEDLGELGIGGLHERAQDGRPCGERLAQAASPAARIGVSFLHASGGGPRRLAVIDVIEQPGRGAVLLRSQEHGRGLAVAARECVVDRLVLSRG